MSTKILPYILKYYDKEVVMLMCEKYDYNEMDALNITDFIMDMYERYHCEAIENAFEDIDALIEERSAVH